MFLQKRLIDVKLFFFSVTFVYILHEHDYIVTNVAKEKSKPRGTKIKFILFLYVSCLFCVVLGVVNCNTQRQ